jgi:hypothetical protein
MSTFHLLQIVYFEALEVFSTDENTLHWMVAEVNNLMPNCSVKKGQFEGKVWGISFEKLSKDRLELVWYLIARLGEKGWEPFAVSPTGRFRYYHFRKELTVD